MTTCSTDRGYRTYWSNVRISVQGQNSYGHLQSMTPHRGFFGSKPTTWPRAFAVEVYDNFEHDEPAFAASFLSPIDAKNVIRERCA